jgi:hypothetical protein
VYYKNTNELNALKELQGHYMNEVNLVMKPCVINYGGTDMALIPWINPENEKATLEFLKNTKATLVGAHLELQGFEMSRGQVCMEGMDKSVFDRFETVLTGHFHVLDMETREMEAIRNPITIFEKIYYDHENMAKFQDLSYLDHKFVKVIVTNKGDSYEFERFIDRVQAQKIHELKIAEDFKEFTGENVADTVSVEDTEQLVINYIDAVTTDLDKSRIKREVSSLMTEAQSMEIV